MQDHVRLGLINVIFVANANVIFVARSLRLRYIDPITYFHRVRTWRCFNWQHSCDHVQILSAIVPLMKIWINWNATKSANRYDLTQLFQLRGYFSFIGTKIWIGWIGGICSIDVITSIDAISSIDVISSIDGICSMFNWCELAPLPYKASAPVQEVDET